ncbi:4207_t:CDS:2 [Dentiscutata heterogama]|uniref:4207_t:CDS:1 n=1 Tax=Dentiscutata heterogama TaxID=1316150 RepID=A0ACA9KA77_9GLOM|nr:4207_t:CDS:2 [Dentiscutata heterogama]
METFTYNDDYHSNEVEVEETFSDTGDSNEVYRDNYHPNEIEETFTDMNNADEAHNDHPNELGVENIPADMDDADEVEIYTEKGWGALSRLSLPHIPRTVFQE